MMAKEKMTYKTEEQKEIVKFIVVLVIVISLIVAVFFLSKVLIKQEAEPTTYQAGEIATNIAIVGTLLNQPETDYYVLAYDTNGTNASAYVTYAEYYTSSKENPIKIYYLDLSSAFNKDYYVTENSNPKATTIKDLKMLDGTLIRVRNGKITEYTEGISNIAEKLKVEE